MRYLPVPNFPIRFWQFGGSFLHFLDIQMNVATLHATCCDSKRVSKKKKESAAYSLEKKTGPFWNQSSELTCCCLPIPLHLIIWSVIVGYMMLYDILSRWKISSISQHSSTSHHSSVPYGVYIYSIIYRSPKKDRKVMYLHFNGIWLFYLVADYYTQYTVFSRSPCFFPPTRKLA